MNSEEDPLGDGLFLDYLRRQWELKPVTEKTAWDAAEEEAWEARWSRTTAEEKP